MTENFNSNNLICACIKQVLEGYEHLDLTFTNKKHQYSNNDLGT